MRSSEPRPGVGTWQPRRRPRQLGASHFAPREQTRRGPLLPIDTSGAPRVWLPCPFQLVTARAISLLRNRERTDRAVSEVQRQRAPGRHSVPSLFRKNRENNGNWPSATIAHIQVYRMIADIRPAQLRSRPTTSPSSGDVQWSSARARAHRREICRADERCRDLNRRSVWVPAVSAEVSESPALDPAYRPTCSPLPTIVPGSANPGGSSAAAVNGSNRIVLSCPRSANINAVTCLDDPY